LQFSDAQQKQENQIKAIRSFIAQGVDIIAFVPIVETGWDTVLKEAKDANIPVIVVDRDVKVADDSLYVAKIGTDSVTEGKNVFKWIDEYMGKENKKPRDGGSQYNVVILEGTVGSWRQPVQRRHPRRHGRFVRRHPPQRRLQRCDGSFAERL
ncbi:substrate-binding domain-containing protein, partial [uncultured Selenomonas sp.]|uniref:substrate-binding domain-containing protein n=1 Tax=uncultured Selenomonas sp. TaxID=159275 RepID=UPI0025D6A416